MANVYIHGRNPQGEITSIKCDDDGDLIVDINNSSSLAQQSTLLNINSNIIFTQTQNNNLITETRQLQKQEQDNINDFDFDLFYNVLVPNVPIPPTNNYIKDPFLRNGWYLKNTITEGNTQLYFFSSDNNLGYKSNSIITLEQLLNNGFYVVMYIDNVVSNEYLIFGLYTRLQNDGNDEQPGFYRSRLSFSVNPIEKLYASELVVLYHNDNLLPKISGIYPTARRVKMSLSQSVGLANGTEEIRFLSINHNSSAVSNSVEWCLTNAGFSNGETTRHFKFSVKRDGENGTVSDEQTHNLLTDTNDKLENLHNDIKDVEDLLRDIKEVEQDIENNTGTAADKLSQLSVFNKSLLVQQVQNNKIHHMMVSRSGGGDTSGALIVASQRTTTHILPLLVAEKFIVESSNDSNKIPNLGLYRVRVEGVGANGELDNEIVDVNGVLGVQTSKNFFHINKIEAILGNISSGSVFVKRQDGIKYCEIDDNGFQVSNGFYMCPNGYQAIISSIVGNDLTSGNLYFIKYNSGNNTRNTIYRFFNRNNANLIFNDGIGLILDERESFYIWNPLDNNDTTHYNIKIELVVKSQLSN